MSCAGPSTRLQRSRRSVRFWPARPTRLAADPKAARQPWTTSDAANRQREALQKMKVGTPQREARISGIAEAGHLPVVRGREVWAQTLTPGAPEDCLEQIGFIGHSERRDALDQQAADPHLAKARAAQQTHDGAHVRQIALLHAVSVPVVLAHGLVSQPLEARVPGEIHVREK